MHTVMNRLVKDDEGQDLIEYALLAAFVALGSVTALILLGPAIKALFDTVVSKLGQASAPTT
jgi:Flp pilus assembly pilin Flp